MKMLFQSKASKDKYVKYLGIGTLIDLGGDIIL